MQKYPLIFCGRFEMTWKQIGYAQRLSPDIRIIRNRVHECLMNAILKCFLDHFCQDILSLFWLVNLHQYISIQLGKN